MSEIIKPTEEQIRALSRFNRLKQISESLGKQIEEVPAGNFVQLNPNGEDKMMFPIDQVKGFIHAGKRSVRLDLIECGLVDKSLDTLFQDVVSGKRPTAQEPKRPDICPQMHPMVPTFKQAKGAQGFREVLFYRCSVGHSVIQYPNPL